MSLEPDSDVALDFDAKKPLSDALASTLPPIALGVGIINLLLAVAHFSVLEGSIRIVMASLAAGSGAVMLGAYRYLRAEGENLQVQTPHIIAFVMGAIVTANTLVHIGMSGDMKQSTNIAIILIAIGCIFNSVRYLVTAIIGVIVAWVSVVNSTIPEPDWVHYGFMALLCASISVIVQYVRVKLIVKTERLAYELALQANSFKALSLRDALTNVNNRRAFDEEFETEWRRSARSKTPISLLLIDVDQFKKYNDHYGHQEGDECLKLIANTVKKSLQRASDSVSRYGGEEFAVLLPETGFNDAQKVAETVRAAVQAADCPHEASDCGVVTLSIGVATASPPEDPNPDTLIKAADAALYDAKENGRNRVESRVIDTVET